MDTTGPVAPPYVVKPFRLLPFHGLMLAASGVGDPASARAFARPYRDVAQRLNDWQASGRIRRDAASAIYLHEYTAAGVTIRGLVGALDLARTSANSPGGQQAVFPHEGVHLEQVLELANRMDEMEINPAPILLVHRGPAAVRKLIRDVLDTPATTSFSDRADQVHRIWALRDPELLGTLQTGLADTHALIADGHHRYAGVPSAAAGSSAHCLGPRAGDARRPERHTPVAGSDPPLHRGPAAGRPRGGLFRAS